MKSMSATTGVILWLAVALFVPNVSSQNCKIEIDGAEVTEDNIRIILQDTIAAGISVKEIDIIGDSVTSAVIEAVKYLDVEVKDAKIIIKTTEQFPTYELAEATASFANNLLLTCADGINRPVTLSSVIATLTNNIKPVFEGQNNAAQDAYEFNLPMPFPKGVHVNWAFAVDMRAVDFDINNADISFTINDPEGNFELEKKSTSDDPKKRYSFAIKTLKLLELTEPTSFTITATDNYPESTSLTTDITVNINIDPENTTPLSPSFSNIFYQAEIEDPTALGPITTHAEIQVLDPPAGELILTLKPAPGNTESIEASFKASSTGNGVIVIELIEKLDPSTINPIVAMELEASEPTSGFSARTVVHILLPRDDCSGCTATTETPITCPPTEPPTTCPPTEEPTTCPTTTACPSNPTCPTSPTCPTVGTCPTPPPCPTQAPCTTTTPAPPASIEFEKDSYATTQDGAYVGTLFTVKATIDGGDGTIEYGVNANSEEMKTRLEMDPLTGELSLKKKASPGSYAFELTALFVEEGDVARAIGYLDISSYGECEDGTTCFKYALVTVDASEATKIDDLIPGSAPTDENCVFTIQEKVEPSLREWFTIDEKTGALGISEDSDVEDPAFDDMPSPQVRLRLNVECEPVPPAASVTRLQEGVTKNEMLVVVNILNRNEFTPIFAAEMPTIVGYPDQDFAQQLFPGSVTQMKASDQDRGDNEKLRYSWDREEKEFTIDELTGEVYPVDGEFAYLMKQLSVKVEDNEGAEGALSFLTTVTVQIIKETDAAVAVIGGANVQDVDSIIQELNSEHENYAWGCLRTSYIADSPEPARQRELDGGLLLVLYAIEKNNMVPATHEEIKSMLSDLENTDWTVSAVETWKVAGGWDESGGGSSGSEEGLTVAVITLSVIVAICLIAIAFIIYFTVYRRGKVDKMIAKYGIKNRTSFSKHRESIAVEAAKKSHVKGLELPKVVEGEMEERKKSTVKFNDEPELIPTDDDVVRL